MSHLVGHSRGRVRYGKVTLSPVPKCWPRGVPWLLRPTVIDPSILSQSLVRWRVSHRPRTCRPARTSRLLGSVASNPGTGSPGAGDELKERFAAPLSLSGDAARRDR